TSVRRRRGLRRAARVEVSRSPASGTTGVCGGAAAEVLVGSGMGLLGAWGDRVTDAGGGTGGVRRPTRSGHDGSDGRTPSLHRQLYRNVRLARMPPSSDVAAQAARRRTFAVISHPDAGKSTLTEALA